MIHHNSISDLKISATIVATLLLGTMVVVNGTEVFGQQEMGEMTSSPSTSFLTNQTSEE
jgi:hypothetical protein